MPIQVMPDMRIVHPDFGDITEDVARELALLREQRNLEDVLAAGERQELIARTCGTESAIGKHGMRLVAQIDETVFNYWEGREGPEFWTHELGYMTKRHPEIAMRPRSEKTTITNAWETPNSNNQTPKTNRGVKGKRGRWAL